jgi:uncharacterized protein
MKPKAKWRASSYLILYILTVVLHFGYIAGNIYTMELLNTNNNFFTAVLTACLIVVMLFLAMLAFPWSRINWGKIRFSQDRNIVVTGFASNQTTNQKASFSVGVQATNDDKQKAIDETNQKSNEIVEAVKTFGIPPEDVKTQNLSIYQDEQFVTDGGVQRSRKGQWRASVNIDVTIKDATKDKVTQFNDMISKTSATNVYGPNFTVDNDKALELENELLSKAIEDAKKKAESVAKSNGLAVGKILSVVDGGGGYGGPIIPFAKEAAMGGGGGPAQVEPGSSSISKSVTVTFELN